MRVSDQNGASLLYIMLEIHHSGRKPSICYSYRSKNLGSQGSVEQEEREYSTLKGDLQPCTTLLDPACTTTTLTCSGAVAAAVRQIQIITTAVARMRKQRMMRAIPVFLATHVSQSDRLTSAHRDVVTTVWVTTRTNKCLPTHREQMIGNCLWIYLHLPISDHTWMWYCNIQ